MSEDCGNLYEKACLSFDKAYLERGNYPKQTILPNEDETIKPLRKLGVSWNNLEDFKYARRSLALVIDALDVNYWADINEKCWETLYSKMQQLKDPKSISREQHRQLTKDLVSYGLSRWPQRTHKTEKRGHPKDQLGKSMCEFICEVAELELKDDG